MNTNGTSKRVTRIEENSARERVASDNSRVFTPTAESKGRASTLRLVAALLWVLAIAAEVGAIILLKRPPVNMVWLIVLIVVDLALAVAGSLLWKKANRLDPASTGRLSLSLLSSHWLYSYSRIKICRVSRRASWGQSLL